MNSRDLVMMRTPFVEHQGPASCEHSIPIFGAALMGYFVMMTPTFALGAWRPPGRLWDFSTAKPHKVASYIDITQQAGILTASHDVFGKCQDMPEWAEDALDKVLDARPSESSFDWMR